MSAPAIRTRAKRTRWFVIDRRLRFLGTWWPNSMHKKRAVAQALLDKQRWLQRFIWAYRIRQQDARA